MAITGYPPQLVDALSNNNISLSRLPVLELGDRTGHSDYIDFLSDQDMIFPLMQFKDKYQRSGLAFRLRGKVDTIVTVGLPDNRESLSVSKLHPIITLFQRYADENRWVHGEGMGSKYFIMDNVYRAVHRPDHQGDACKTCLGMPALTDGKIAWACSIIDDTDPVWTIDGEIKQV